MDRLPYNDEFARAVHKFLNGLEPADAALWEPLFAHCAKAKAASPRPKWLLESGKLIATLNPKEILNVVENIISIIEKELLLILKSGCPDAHFLAAKSLHSFKGLLWATTPLDDDHLSKKIENLAFTAYKKIPDYGAVSAKLGNACLHALALLPPDKAIMRLALFKHKIKSRSTLKILAKLSGQVADRAGIREDMLEEMAIDNYGLSLDRRYELVVGKARGILQLDETGRGLTMWRNKGKLQKSIPADVKRNFSQSLHDFKTQVAAIRSAIPMQKNRIENLYLEEREWGFEHWFQFYIQHPLVAIVARRLIWEFVKNDKQDTAIFYGGKFINAKEKELKWIGAETKVRLWHPINSRPEQIFEWRNFLERLGIQQAFKQAHREVYILTDAERNTYNYSNRFAAHILKQNQFAVLCRVRNWYNGARGAWYPKPPNRYVPHWQIKAEFWVETNWDDDQTDGGLSEYIFSDQVRFYKYDQQLPLEEVPPMLFSEIMRDVDLFVGVTSIGNDPNWQDGNNPRLDNYWAEFAFGDLTQTAKTRKEILENLIPKLKIAKQASFSGKFIVIKGKIRSYKIHLGSGNILMTPNDQYLCIVPDASQKEEKVFLPFEGDRMLSIILSKAFMLANDIAITDSSITSQIEDL